MIAQEAIRVRADLRDHRLVIPRRVADEMLKLLQTAVLNHGGHRLDRAVLRLRQSAQPAGHGALSRVRVRKKWPWWSRNASNAATIPSTNDPVSHHPNIRLPDEPPASIRPTIRINCE